MTAPIRLRLSRARSFDLQAASRAINGLPAVNVARPGRWGNPFNFRDPSFCWIALAYGCRGDAAGRQEASVKAFREWISPSEGRQTQLMEQRVVMESGGKQVQIGAGFSVGPAPDLADVRRELEGKNLACWCEDDSCCHADVYLKIAN